jgi:hypothetical protein
MISFRLIMHHLIAIHRIQAIKAETLRGPEVVSGKGVLGTEPELRKTVA